MRTFGDGCGSGMRVRKSRCSVGQGEVAGGEFLDGGRCLVTGAVGSKVEPARLAMACMVHCVPQSTSTGCSVGLSSRMVLYGIVLYGVVWYGMVWYGMVRYAPVAHCPNMLAYPWAQPHQFSSVCC